MAGKTHVEDCLLQDKNDVREDMMAAGLSPSLQNKLSTVLCDNEKWHLKSKEGDESAKKLYISTSLQISHYLSLLSVSHYGSDPGLFI